MAVFTLMLIVCVFGYICNKIKRVESSIQASIKEYKAATLNQPFFCSSHMGWNWTLYKVPGRVKYRPTDSDNCSLGHVSKMSERF